MKLRNTPAERAENLMAYFGWQGGTILAVANNSLFEPAPGAEKE